MALGRGTFENAFSGINPYNNVDRKPQELSPSGSNRNQPIGSAFSSNIGSNTSKMGFFGKKDESETNHSDIFYGKNFPSGRSNLADNILSNQMNNMNLYGFNKTKEQIERSSSPNWGSSGWSQMGGGFPQGLNSNNLSNNISSASASRQNSINNNLLQFSRSISSQSFSNNIPASAGLPSSQSSSDLTNNFQSNFKMMSGQSSPRSGLLSMSQQLPNSSQQQQQQPTQQQQSRGVIGQLPSMSMQGHSSPSHSPGLNINKLPISQPSRSTILPPSSNVLPNSSLANSTSLPGFVGGMPIRTTSHFGQSILNSVIPSSQSPSGNDTTTSNINNLVSNQLGTNINSVMSGGQTNAFDTDFPALANRLGNSSSSRPGQNSFSFVMSTGSKALEGNQEFQIQSEDFPALPGATPQQMQGEGGGVLPPTQLGAITQPPITNHIGQHMENKENILGDTYGLASSYEQILKDGRLNLDKKPKTPVSGIQTNSSGVITNIPSGMVTDQFGMIGLLTFIRAAETEPNLVTLALGSDLTTLGLNLNSTESLYHTFGSPFSDTTCKPHEIDFYAPQEYLISSYIRDKLAPIKLGRYGEDLLFYLYYTNCGDILQLAAAAELYARDWRYHKDERVWITRFPGMEPQIKTNTYERGTYYYFDPQGWRKVAKEFHVEYERLEAKPTAQALQQQQQQAQQQAQQQQQQQQLA